MSETLWWLAWVWLIAGNVLCWKYDNWPLGLLSLCVATTLRLLYRAAPARPSPGW